MSLNLSPQSYRVLHFGNDPIRPDGEIYGQRSLGSWSSYSNSGPTSVVNRKGDNGKIYPLLVTLRPAQMQVLVDIREQLQTLNANLTQTMAGGFDKMAQALASRNL